MPVIHIYLWPGRMKEAKLKMIKAMTKVFTDMKILAEAVEIIIHEVPKENWAVGGELACDKFSHIP